MGRGGALKRQELKKRVFQTVVEYSAEKRMCFWSTKACRPISQCNLYSNKRFIFKIILTVHYLIPSSSLRQKDHALQYFMSGEDKEEN